MRKAAGIAVALLFAAFVFWNFGGADRFAVSGVILEQTAGGAVLSGTVRNRGERAPLVNVEVTFFGPDGREVHKEVVELRDLDAGKDLPFRTPPRSGREVASYSVYINAGRNPYGN